MAYVMASSLFALYFWIAAGASENRITKVFGAGLPLFIVLGVHDASNATHPSTIIHFLTHHRDAIKLTKQRVRSAVSARIECGV
jgi:hypothetical protein